MIATVLGAFTLSCQPVPMGVCTLAGCDSSVGFELEVADGNALIGARLQVCRNELCGEAQITELPTTFEGRPYQFTGGLAGVVRLYQQPSGYAVSAIVPEEGEFPYGLADGDVYTVELRDRDSMLLAAERWSATYHLLEPNGPDCGPTCLRARLTPL